MKGPRKKAEQRRKVLYKRGGRGRKKKASRSSPKRPVVSRPSQRCACLSFSELCPRAVRKSDWAPSYSASLSEALAMCRRVFRGGRPWQVRFAPGCEQQGSTSLVPVTGLVPTKLHLTTDSQILTQTESRSCLRSWNLNTVWSNCRATKTALAPGRVPEVHQL